MRPLNNRQRHRLQRMKNKQQTGTLGQRGQNRLARLQGLRQAGRRQEPQPQPISTAPQQQFSTGGPLNYKQEPQQEYSTMQGNISNQQAQGLLGGQVPRPLNKLNNLREQSYQPLRQPAPSAVPNYANIYNGGKY